METRRRVAGSIRTEGGLLPSDLLEKIKAVDPDVPGLKDADFGLPAGERAREATTRSWNRLVGAWAALEAVRVAAEANDPLVGATRDRFLVPLFEELGFGRLPVARDLQIEGTPYPISHFWEGRVPVHLVGYGVELDTRTKGVRGAAGAAPHALVQEYLNRADEALWGIVSNGRTLRLLRDSTSLTRQAYVEFDLEAIFEGELYADFALLWSVLHRSRFEGEKPADCLLERWTKKAADDGTRALDQLRRGVEKAIGTLGAGFLATTGNSALIEVLRSGELDAQDYYRELLRLVYRLIFLFTAEDRRDEETGRELLLDPSAPEDAVERYRRHYSTVRLRSFAGRRRGSRHPDLWVGLKRVVAALSGDGAPTIALPALGSFLFGSAACPHLDAAELTNEDLLDAVRALATIEEDRRLRLVDYRNLGAEELGGIYEGLLELHPRIEIDANPPRFSLSSAAGNERKSSGSYYTPTSLISCLLDSALDPVLDEAVRGKSGSSAETAILGLAVVDPAAGSGHFLIGAAHRIAKRLAAVRSGEGEAPPTQVRRALRDVISHCIFAVDINPMAVELCKVSLWLEAIEPGRPLSFLDAHIKCGNSLLGTTPNLAAGGVPDVAYEPITGDDKAAAREWRRTNAGERAGQYSLFGASLADPVAPLAAASRALENLPEDSLANVAEKGARHLAYLASAAHVRAKSSLNAWCAAFVAPRALGAPSVTTATVRSLGSGDGEMSAAACELVERTAAEYAFFHWPQEFPAVFERGGFDVVLGNPPWERMKLQEKEFFAERNPAIASARNAAERKRMISAIQVDDPPAWAEFQSALRHTEGEVHLLRGSGRFPLAGRGDINTYAAFAELMWTSISPHGRVGLIAPTGIATDDTTKWLFGAMIERRALVSLHAFENEEFVFPAVHHATKFCLMTLAGSAESHDADLVFYARRVRDLDELERHFTLTPDEFALLNPNTRTCPIFRSRSDAELAKAVYRQVPVLVRDGDGPSENAWGVEVHTRLFHMAEDSHLFLSAAGDDRQPLYEGKMINQFDHRSGTYEGQTPEQARQGVLPPVADALKADPAYSPRPRYWVGTDELDRRLRGLGDPLWLLAWRDVTSSVASRTMVASALPRVAPNHKLPFLHSRHPYFGLVLANLNAFVLDWVARQKVGGIGFSYFQVKQLPILDPSAYVAKVPWNQDTALGDWLRPRVVELVYTSRDQAAFAEALGWVGPPFAWSSDRREQIRAEIDAAVAIRYEISAEALSSILDSFWVVADRERKQFGTYRTKDLVLDAYGALSDVTVAAPFTSKLTPPPGDPQAAHPPSAGEEPGHWVPWSEVLAPAPQASPGTQNVGSSAAPPVQPTLATPARAVAEPALALFASDTTSAWRPEAAVAPAELMMGARVRHRAKGEGTVLLIRSAGKGNELLIRFDAMGEAWIVFGFGVLEFRRDRNG